MAFGTVPTYLAAWHSACPRCGKGPLFAGFLTLHQTCAVCGLPLAGLDSGDGPAVFLIFVLGFLVVPVALLVSMNVDWPVWLHGIVWGVVILGLAIGMLRPAKAFVVALEYKHRGPDAA